MINWRQFVTAVEAALVIPLFVFGIAGLCARQQSMPPELSEAERAAWQLIVPMPQVSMTISFVSDREFGEKPDTAGYTMLGSRPCEFRFRASEWSIVSEPETGYAIFRHPPVDGDPIAHEVLHCLRGNWHPDWREIHAARPPFLRFIYSIGAEPERDRRDE